jgi:hypothetical protein
MSEIYAMRRANGDWFALEDAGRLCLPVFHNSHDAFMARLRTAEMLLFSPIALDAQLLNEIVEGPGKVDFCMVDNPFGSLKNGSPLPREQLDSLIHSAEPPRRWKWLSRPWSET